MHALSGAAMQIRSAFAAAGIKELPPTAYDQFEIYLELLLRWNLRINLTAVREPEADHPPPFCGVRICRPASARGYNDFAGLWLGRRTSRYTYRDLPARDPSHPRRSPGKKIAFLSEALRVLRLAGEVFSTRVETMPIQLVFDAVTMRAVEKLALAMPFAIQHAKHYLVLFTTRESAGAYMAQELRWLAPLAIPDTEQMVVAIGQRVSNG